MPSPPRTGRARARLSSLRRFGSVDVAIGIALATAVVVTAEAAATLVPTAVRTAAGEAALDGCISSPANVAKDDAALDIFGGGVGEDVGFVSSGDGSTTRLATAVASAGSPAKPQLQLLQQQEQPSAEPMYVGGRGDGGSGGAFQTFVFGVLSPVVVALTVINNGFVCAVLLRPAMRTPTNLLLVALAVADTLTGLAPLPHFVYFFTLGSWREPAPYAWCHAYKITAELLPTVFHTASIWLTTTLAVQRYLCVCRPPTPATASRCSTSAARRRSWLSLFAPAAPALPRLRSARTAAIAIAAVYVASVLAHISRFFEYRYEPLWLPPPSTIGIAAETELSSTPWIGHEVLAAFATLPSTPHYHQQLLHQSGWTLGCIERLSGWAEAQQHTYFPTYVWFRVLCIHAAPCAVLLVVNALLVSAIRRAGDRRRALRIASSPALPVAAAAAASTTAGAPGSDPRCGGAWRHEHGRRRERCDGGRRTTRMLVVVVGVFLLVELPLGIALLLVIVHNSLLLPTSTDAADSSLAAAGEPLLLDEDVQRVVHVAINFAILLSYPLNFFIYAGMSKSFRDAVAASLRASRDRIRALARASASCVVWFVAKVMAAMRHHRKGTAAGTGCELTVVAAQHDEDGSCSAGECHRRKGASASSSVATELTALG